jgi:hypothetical protein
MKGAKIRDTDRGYKKRMKVLEKFQGASISVGVHENDGAGAHSEGVSVADVGAFHEFGTDDIPERSFVRGWFDEQGPENDRLIASAAKRVATGKAEIQQALDQVGAVMAGNMVARIRSGIAPELADSTVSKKGSSTPLIDSGQLTQAITWKAKP